MKNKINTEVFGTPCSFPPCPYRTCLESSRNSIGDHEHKWSQYSYISVLQLTHLSSTTKNHCNQARINCQSSASSPIIIGKIHITVVVLKPRAHTAQFVYVYVNACSMNFEVFRETPSDVGHQPCVQVQGMLTYCYHPPPPPWYVSLCFHVSAWPKVEKVGVGSPLAHACLMNPEGFWVR